nr:translation initiation factor IF-2-like [Caretta caretta]XP_048678254.1 translation initiation factor IF-2-like [Caretta caretta]
MAGPGTAAPFAPSRPRWRLGGGREGGRRVRTGRGANGEGAGTLKRRCGSALRTVLCRGSAFTSPPLRSSLPPSPVGGPASAGPTSRAVDGGGKSSKQRFNVGCVWAGTGSLSPPPGDRLQRCLRLGLSLRPAFHPRAPFATTGSGVASCLLAPLGCRPRSAAPGRSEQGLSTHAPSAPSAPVANRKLQGQSLGAAARGGPPGPGAPGKHHAPPLPLHLLPRPVTYSVTVESGSKTDQRRCAQALSGGGRGANHTRLFYGSSPAPGAPHPPPVLHLPDGGNSGACPAAGWGGPGASAGGDRRPLRAGGPPFSSQDLALPGETAANSWGGRAGASASVAWGEAAARPAAPGGCLSPRVNPPAAVAGRPSAAAARDGP